MYLLSPSIFLDFTVAVMKEIPGLVLLKTAFDAVQHSIFLCNLLLVQVLGICYFLVSFLSQWLCLLIFLVLVSSSSALFVGAPRAQILVHFSVLFPFLGFFDLFEVLFSVLFLCWCLSCYSFQFLPESTSAVLSHTSDVLSSVSSWLSNHSLIYNMSTIELLIIPPKCNLFHP